MTVDEMAEVETRLAIAKEKKRRVDLLQEGLKKLLSGDVYKLLINLTADAAVPVSYSEDPPTISSPKWREVCWTAKEVGLRDEVQEAISAILDRRLREAEAELLAV